MRGGTKFLIGATSALAITLSTVYALKQRSIARMNASLVFTGNDKWQSLKISSIKQESPDSRVITFQFPNKNSMSGLHLASAIIARYVPKSGGKPVIRPYTPISPLNKRGEMELLIKEYKDGQMTPYLFSLGVGDVVEFKGPKVKFNYKPNMFNSVTMLCGGTGVTPMYQMIMQILHDPKDRTTVNLLFGNKSPKDILLKKELDQLAREHAGRLNIKYFVDNGAKSSEYSVGHISKESIASHSADHVFVCGPPAFTKAYAGSKHRKVLTTEGVLKDLQYNDDQVTRL